MRKWIFYSLIVMVVAAGCGQRQRVFQESPIPRITSATPAPSPTPAPTATPSPTPPPPVIPLAAPTRKVQAPPADRLDDTTSPIIPLIYQVFGPVDGPRAIRVARCESGLNPHERTGSHYGLMQLSRKWHEGRARRLGYTWDQMYEPLPNLTVAHDLFLEQGWRPWTCKP